MKIQGKIWEALSFPSSFCRFFPLWLPLRHMENICPCPLSRYQEALLSLVFQLLKKIQYRSGIYYIYRYLEERYYMPCGRGWQEGKINGYYGNIFYLKRRGKEISYIKGNKKRLSSFWGRRFYFLRKMSCGNILNGTVYINIPGIDTIQNSWSTSTSPDRLRSRRVNGRLFSSPPLKPLWRYLRYFQEKMPQWFLFSFI